MITISTGGSCVCRLKLSRKSRLSLFRLTASGICFFARANPKRGKVLLLRRVNSANFCPESFFAD